MPICFDLDGTLGSFGGGYLLLREALGELWGEAPTAEELQRCQGSTDWEIVDELHRSRFRTPLSDEAYQTYDRACLARFQGAFNPAGRSPVIFRGIVEGMRRLLDDGHPVWLVSGNTPGVLNFKAQALGVDPRAQQLGSLPRHDRVALIQRVTAEGPRPHLYLGDRPHDRDAAEAAGIPFLGIGPAVPGEHPILGVETEAEHLVAAVQRLLET